MSMPKIEKSENPIDREQSINNLIGSVALMETGLSHIINAEGEKIQKVVKHAEDEDVPLEDMIKVNDSAEKMVNSISKLEMILQNKLDTSKDLDTGGTPGPTGPTGPIGPTGNTGPTGPGIEDGQQLFNLLGTTGSEHVTYSGNLSFNSQTMNINVEDGPVVNIEESYKIGAIIPFSSGRQFSLSTGTGINTRYQVATVAFGHGSTIVSPNDPIVLPAPTATLETVQTDFSVPANGTINSISAYFTAMSGGIVLQRIIVVAELYQAIDNESNEFIPVPGTRIEFPEIIGSVVPSILLQHTITDLNIPISAHTRLMMVYSCYSPTSITSLTMSGYMSGSIEIR